MQKIKVIENVVITFWEDGIDAEQTTRADLLVLNNKIIGFEPFAVFSDGTTRFYPRIMRKDFEGVYVVNIYTDDNAIKGVEF